jgi:hypothetical protein
LQEPSFEGAHFIDATQFATPLWTKEEEKVGHLPHRIASNVAGTELTVPFIGTAVGVFYLAAPDSGDFEWSVDGSEFKRETTWSTYGSKQARPYSKILTDKLLPGLHFLKLRVLGEKKPESAGTWVRLGAIMVNDPTWTVPRNPAPNKG